MPTSDNVTAGGSQCNGSPESASICACLNEASKKYYKNFRYLGVNVIFESRHINNIMMTSQKSESHTKNKILRGRLLKYSSCELKKKKNEILDKVIPTVLVSKKSGKKEMEVLKKQKIKKVMKGLQKASKTHAAQAKTLKGVINDGSRKRNGKKT